MMKGIGFNNPKCNLLPPCLTPVYFNEVHDFTHYSRFSADVALYGLCKT